MSDFYFDEQAAERVRSFLETFCIQSKHPFTGKPLTLLPWQWDNIVKPLYGWRKTKDGTRRYNRAIIFCPKKVGKTTLLAGLSLHHLFEYPGSEVYCIASDVQQASVLYDQAADFAELHQELAQRLWVKRHIKTILDPAQPDKQRPQSVLRVLSSTPEGKSGFSANFIAYDELAEWNGTNARIIWDRLVNAGMARVNSLQVVISTAQYDRSHLGYEQYRYAQDLLAGKINDPHTLPVIYSLPEDQDWTQEDNWWPCVPSIDHTVSRDYYRQEFQKTQNSPSDETRFRTFLLCQWVGHTEQWIASHKWAQCKEQYTEEDLHGADAIVGIDMARRYDLASYVLLIPRDDRIYLLPRFFIPGQLAAQKEKEDKITYSRWSKAGYVTLTPGDVIDPATIRQHLRRDAEHFRLTEIRYDPYGFEETRQLLEEEGHNLIEVSQSYQGMAPATAHLERLILDKRIAHNGNPCLDWCLQNTTVKIDSHDRIMLDKIRSRGRIDGIVASVIGLTGYLGQEPEEQWEGSMVMSV